MPDWKEYVRHNLRLEKTLPEQQEEIVNDIARQLDDAYNDALSRGCSAVEAEAEARQHISDWRKFSREVSLTGRHHSSVVDRFVRESPSHNRPLIIDSLKQDIRFTLRTIIRKPAFFALAVITLALGVGANTAIFSIVNAVLLKPLPYKDSSRLVQVWERRPRQDRERNPVSPADFLDWREQNRVFETIAAYLNQPGNITESGQPERLSEGVISTGFFSMLGVEPALGRTFVAEEEEFGKHRVVMLSDRLWRRRFNSDPGIIGKTIPLDREPYVVVGVLPRQFRFAKSQYFSMQLDSPDIWVPLAFQPAQRANRALHFLAVFGRLKPSVTLDQARSEMDVLARRLESAYPVNNGHYTNVFSLYEETVGNVRQSLLMLLSAVGFVLLIACANVANLVLLRTSGRRKEIAVRTAIGSTRARTVRQLITESVTLALVAGAVGVLVASILIPALMSLAPEHSPRMDEIAIDVRVLGFTLLISILCGLGFGIAPVLQVSELGTNDTLKESGRGGGVGKRTIYLRRVLVVAEVAVALLLLIGAGLMIRSFAALQTTPSGFNADNVLTLQIVLSRARYGRSDQILHFFTELRDRVTALPGVLSVGAAQSLPSTGGAGSTFFAIEERPQPPGQGFNTGLNAASAGYFETMQIPLKQGRAFTDADMASSQSVIIVNETMARQFWPNDNPIGREIVTGDQVVRAIVGVVGDTRQDGPDKPVRPEMFYVFGQNPFLNLVVRSSSDPVSLAGAIRSQVLALDPEQPVAVIRTMQQVLDDATTPTRFNSFVLGCFAILALLLAIVGLYGVMSYFVTDRFHEIGIRMALGAQRVDVIRMIVRQGLALVMTGVIIGTAASLVLTRFLSKLLFGVNARDPWTIAGVALLLIATASIACYIPARRAAGIDPIEAVRYE